MKETSSPKKTSSSRISALAVIQENPKLLKERVQKLQYLCMRFDPYNGEIPEEILQLLLEFNIDPQEHNPFSLTENLLVLLDQLTTLSKKIP